MTDEEFAKLREEELGHRIKIRDLVTGDKLTEDQRLSFRSLLEHSMMGCANAVEDITTRDGFKWLYDNGFQDYPNYDTTDPSPFFQKASVVVRKPINGGLIMVTLEHRSESTLTGTWKAIVCFLDMVYFDEKLVIGRGKTPKVAIDDAIDRWNMAIEKACQLKPIPAFRYLKQNKENNE